MICENLDVWKRSKDLAVEVYKELRNCKDWGYKDQITRSVLSVSSNIAEGMERKSSPDRIRFLVIAKGSIAEFKVQAQIGTEIDYIDGDLSDKWMREAEVVSKMLQKLIESFERTQKA